MYLTKKFNPLTYLQLVETLVSDYFNDEGEYVPHLGRISSMLTFGAEFGYLTDENASLNEAADFISNDQFISEYEDALLDKGGLTFGSAMVDALEIVEERKSGTNRLLTLLTKFMEEATEKLAEFVNYGNIETISKIASAMGNTDDWAGALISAYKNGDLESIQKDTLSAAVENILPFNNKK